MGAKRPGGKRPGGKRLGGETTRGGNGLGAKRPGFLHATAISTKISYIGSIMSIKVYFFTFAGHSDLRIGLGYVHLCMPARTEPMLLAAVIDMLQAVPINQRKPRHESREHRHLQANI